MQCIGLPIGLHYWWKGNVSMCIGYTSAQIYGQPNTGKPRQRSTHAHQKTSKDPHTSDITCHCHPTPPHILHASIHRCGHYSIKRTGAT